MEKRDLQEKKIPGLLVGPFEAAFSLLLIGATFNAIGITDKDPFFLLLPEWVFWLYMVSYVIAGLCIFLGLCFSRGDVEGAGLTIFIPLLITRGILMGEITGWNGTSVVSLIFAIVFIAACLGRLYVILRT